MRLQEALIVEAWLEMERSVARQKPWWERKREPVLETWDEVLSTGTAGCICTWRSGLLNERHVGWISANYRKLTRCLLNINDRRCRYRLRRQRFRVFLLTRTWILDGASKETLGTTSEIMIQESEINQLDTVSFKYCPSQEKSVKRWKHYTVEQGWTLDIYYKEGRGKVSIVRSFVFDEIWSLVQQRLISVMTECLQLHSRLSTLVGLKESSHSSYQQYVTLFWTIQIHTCLLSVSSSACPLAQGERLCMIMSLTSWEYL
jgi:hypothetical protein